MNELKSNAIKCSLLALWIVFLLLLGNGAHAQLYQDTLRPTGEGPLIQWVASTGDKWTTIDEDVANSSDYILETVDEQAQDITFGNMTQTNADSARLKISGAYTTGLSDREIEVRFDTGAGFELMGSLETQNTVYEEISILFANPTDAQLNALIVRVRAKDPPGVEQSARIRWMQLVAYGGTAAVPPKRKRSR